MSCCAPGAEYTLQTSDPATAREEVRLASHVVGDGLRQTDLSVPGVHCGGCIRTVETALAQLPGVVQARVNLSTRRVTIRWRDDAPPAPFIATLNAVGYDAHLFEAGLQTRDDTQAELVRALAVAGFGASNIMLLSVSVWSGAEPATRDLFHWISALIALPTVAYAGRIFFRSAWRALSHGRTNMDVPISIGVLLAVGLSLYETIHSGAHAYFDASVTLLFFLLIGRTLDHVMRERARTAVKGLARLAARGALVVRDDGSRAYLPIDEIAPGMQILLSAGERVPVDARVVAGQSDLDCALVTGESLPQPALPGTALQAGTLNLTGPLTIAATAAAKDSFLAEMMRMMEAAEGGRSAYRRIADRAAQLYAPVVHLTALLTCIGWVLISGDWHRALTIAIAVLIITCPCALGLAVPMVQVVAARRLFEAGVMVRDGTALERLATIDRAVFDKTGTLTLGQPRLVNAGAVPPEALAVAAALAAHSRHPHSRALAAAGRSHATGATAFDSVNEWPGLGLEARSGATLYRLGRAGWAQADASTGEQGTVLTRDGELLARFVFDDRLRPDAEAAVAALKAQGLAVEILSGDREAAVGPLAERLGVGYRANVRPGDKTARIAALKADGHRPLMVGDGLNDAPALAAAHASMAPASAADVGRNAADLVFLRDSLEAVPQALTVAREAGRLIRQNLGIAVLYNLIAVPIAVAGLVTPLVAAIAMSGSSVLVVGNALRLKGGNRAAATHVDGARHTAAARSLEAAE
jgi:Cu2+-exporting ATPase